MLHLVAVPMVLDISLGAQVVDRHLLPGPAQCQHQQDLVPLQDGLRLPLDCRSVTVGRATPVL